MPKKVKKQPKQVKQLKQIDDPKLEQVDEEHAFEIEYDEETNEAVLVHHYRRQWGDGFDADVEHGWSIDDTQAVILELTEILELQKKKLLDQAISQGLLIQKSTPEMIEGNPLQDMKKQESDTK